MGRSANNLIWVDMEMTGLDPQSCLPIEIATIITDSDLNTVAEGPSLVIHQPDAALDAMDEWNTSHHGRSGLTAAVKASETTMAEAERQTLAFIKAHTLAGRSPLCGNSVGQDRRFLRRYMPELEAHFHYRIIDTSTVKELARRWFSVSPPAKSENHRALDDIRESISELVFYRENIFKQPD
jgi:oligoribonuclease